MWGKIGICTRNEQNIPGAGKDAILLVYGLRANITRFLPPLTINITLGVADWTFSNRLMQKPWNLRHEVG
jgi:hypothetical protein